MGSTRGTGINQSFKLRTAKPRPRSVGSSLSHGFGSRWVASLSPSRAYRRIASLTLLLATSVCALATAAASTHALSRPSARATPRSATPRTSSATASGVKRRAEVYWGAVIGPQFTGVQAPYDMKAVTDFVKRDAGGKRPSIIPMYQPFDDCSGARCVPYAFPTAQFKNIRSYGAIPMVSWGSSSLQSGDREDVSDRNFTLRDVIDGRYNALITAWAKQAKAFGHPFFLRFDWEMNGNWFVWGNNTNTNTAAEYIAAWRHVHNIFTRIGATNADWVWCPNDGNAKGSIANLASFYPGNAYVNWTCADAYNAGGTSGGPWENWNQVAGPTYRAIQKIAPHKPMMIGEFNSVSVGGSKPAWIAQTLSEIPSAYPDIHAIILFDTDPGFQLEDQPASEAAFARGIRNPAYATNSFRTLKARVIPAF